MKKSTAKAAALVLTLLLLFLSGCGTAGNDRDAMSGRIRIMLGSAEGLVILSVNCLDILPGETAAFDIKLEDGYRIVSLSHGIYDEDEGRIVYAGAGYPATIRVGTEKDRGEGDHTAGPASDSPEGGVPSGTPDAEKLSEAPFFTETPEPSPTPEPTPEPTPTPVAVTLRDPKVRNVLAGPDASDDPSSKTVRIVYHAEGGSIASTASQTAAEFFPVDFYYCPNVLPDVGYFYKEGYLLAGYSTMPSGEGDIYCPGFNIIPQGDVIDLYCVWRPLTDEKDFSVSFENDHAVVNSYNGSDAEVVVPPRFEGKKTLVIASGAFSSRTIERIYIPKYVEVIEDRAFEGLSKLREVFLSDSVLFMSDAAFSGCGSFSKLCVMAVRNPVYQNSVVGCAGSVKYERLITRTERKIVIISGSGSLYGIDSEAIRKRMNSTHEVVNLGVHVNLSAAFLCELASVYANPCDIVILSPEINGYQLGVNGFSTTMWQILEGCYDAVAAVDIRNYTGVFDSFAAFNRTRRSVTERSYRDKNSEINVFGDLSYGFSGINKIYKTKQEQYLLEGGTVSFSDAVSIMKRYYGSVNRSLEKVTAKGGAALFSFSPVDRASLDPSSGGFLSDEEGEGPVTFPAIEEYESYVDGHVSAERISSAADYIFEPEYFWNSEWHPNGAGRALRTVKLSDDILAFISRHPEMLLPAETPAPTGESTERPSDSTPSGAPETTPDAPENTGAPASPADTADPAFPTEAATAGPSGEEAAK